MSTESEITVGLYLFKRLHQLGVKYVQGVPGDFNLVALDLLPEADLIWAGESIAGDHESGRALLTLDTAGNTNELNAGYAADGYARIKGLGAVITTFGVGELSALAAV